MEIEKAWLSTETGKKSRYGYRTIGGILGIVLLMVLLLLGGTFLSRSLGIDKKVCSLILLFAVSVLGIGLVALMSRRAIQDATIFFLTENNRLWVMDARNLSKHGDGFLGFAVSAMETQAFLRKQVHQSFVPDRADEILKVLGIKENHNHYAVRCQVRHPDKSVTRCTCFLIKGIPEEEQLLREFARRRTWENMLEVAPNRKPLYILLSGMVFAVCVLVCVLSHPAIAVLSDEIYFPCMGAAFVAFCFLFYFIIRQHRGE